MSVDFDKFLNWAEKRFGDVVVRGDEIKINSIFCEDYKHHLWCNPHGGKKGRDHGVYRCWKTDKRGSLVSLVMEVDKCSYIDALEILDATNVTIYELERQVEELMATRKPQTPVQNMLALPPLTHLISSLPENDFFKNEAEIYLKSRKLDTDGMFVCCSPETDYFNRIIIPYYDKQSKLVYFNGRYIGKNSKIARYLGPPKECGVGKSDVVFCKRFPAEDSKIYLTEGEFDALSLDAAGLCGVALGGKEIYERQVSFLRGYKITICFDTDKYGKGALVRSAEVLEQQGFNHVSYVRPPCQFKDWNDMLFSLNGELIAAYISMNEKMYDSMDFI